MSLPEDVPFEVVREPWNIYDVGHNLTLKVKVVLVKILKPPGVPLDSAAELVFQTQPFFAVWAPLESKKTPETREITSELMNESVIEDLDPKCVGGEVSNEYRLENGGFIRLKLIFNRVALTDLYGADGCPVIAIRHQIAPQIHMPRTKRKRSQRTPIVD
jgi:hypothetical protein